jgi:uncharacterized protein
MKEPTKRQTSMAVARSAKPSFEEALASVPVFPLPRTVLFPDAALPLHVFEPRYRAMIADCLATHRVLAVAPIVEGEDEHGRPRIASIVGGGVIVEHHPLPDGRSNIVVLGHARLTIEEELPPEVDVPYRRVRGAILVDRDVRVPEADRTAMVAAATMFASEVKKHEPNFAFRLPPHGAAGQLADACAYQLVVDPAARQAALEELDPAARVRMVIHQLAAQQGAMMRDVRSAVLN